MTPERAKLGPDNNFTAQIYIYIYIYAGESNNKTFFAGFGIQQQDALPFNNGTCLISHYKNRGFRVFSEIPISDRWFENVLRRLDPDSHQTVFFCPPSKFAETQIPGFLAFVASSSFCLTSNIGNATKMMVSDVPLSPGYFAQNCVFQMDSFWTNLTAFSQHTLTNWSALFGPELFLAQIRFRELSVLVWFMRKPSSETFHDFNAFSHYCGSTAEIAADCGLNNGRVFQLFLIWMLSFQIDNDVRGNETRNVWWVGDRGVGNVSHVWFVLKLLR